MLNRLSQEFVILLFLYNVHSFLLLQHGTFLPVQESTAKKLPTEESYQTTSCYSEDVSPKNLMEIIILSCADGGRFGGKATQTSRTLRSLIICTTRLFRRVNSLTLKQYPPLTFASSAIIVLFAIAAFCFLLFMLFGGSETTEESHRFLRRFFAIAQNDVFFICRIGKFYLLAGQARLVLLTNRKFYNFTLFKTIRN